MAALQDICILITDGKHGDCQNEDGSGFYFISCKDVRDGRIDYSSARQITKADYLDTHRRTQLEANDIVVTNSGTIGRMALMPNAPETNRTTFQKSVAILKPNPEKVIAKWLYYSLIANRNTLIARAGGTAQKNLLLRDMRAFTVEVPPLPTQRKIATILSAYDDLIENNTRRIKILEEMAQYLYREWFVNFKFPGHESVRMVDSPLGKIPEGWEVDELGGIVSEIIDYRGKTPKKIGGNWSEEGVIALSALNVKQGKLINLDKAKRINESLYRKWMKSELMKGDILMTSEAPLGELYFLVEKRTYCLSQRLFSIRANTNRINSAILFYSLSSPEVQKAIKTRATGTTVLGIRQSQLRRVPILIPPLKFQERISSIFEDFLMTINNLQIKIDILRRTRDLLLPKLISGELNVENLEIKVEGLNS